MKHALHDIRASLDCISQNLNWIYCDATPSGPSLEAEIIPDLVIQIKQTKERFKFQHGTVDLANIVLWDIRNDFHTELIGFASRKLPFTKWDNENLDLWVMNWLKPTISEFILEHCF